MPDSKVTELFLKQGYYHGPRQKQTKNLSRVAPTTRDYGILPREKNPKSPAREGFTIKNDRAHAGPIQPDRESAHRIIPPGTLNTDTDRDYQIHTYKMKSRKEENKS